MLSLSEIKTGKNIILDGEPFAVLYHEHSKTGRAGAVLRTKLKNLATGTILEKNFQGSDRIEEADISKSKAQFIYADGNNYCFMDSENYEQFSLPREALENAINYLKEGTEIILLYFKDHPINIELPIKIKLKVSEAPPNVRGNSASSPAKIVKLETGLEISVPIFIKEGDEVIVNTQKGEYTERA